MNQLLKTKLKKFIKYFGIKSSIEYIGSQKLIKECFEDDEPICFMDDYINLKTDSDGGLRLYLDSNNNVVFFTSELSSHDYIFFNDKRIWWYFSVIKGMDYDDIRELLTNWLKQHYPQIKGFATNSFRYD